MRDCRNVLHASRGCLEKQKHHCDGGGKRVRGTFQGVSDAQNRAGTIGLYQAEKAQDQPVRSPSEKISEPPLFFHQTAILRTIRRGQ